MTTFQEINTYKPFHFEKFGSYNREKLSFHNPIVPETNARKIKPQ